MSAQQARVAGRRADRAGPGVDDAPGAAGTGRPVAGRRPGDRRMRTGDRRRRGARAGRRRGAGHRAGRRGDRRDRGHLPTRPAPPACRRPGRRCGPAAAAVDPAGGRHRAGLPTGDRRPAGTGGAARAGGADAAFDPGNIASDEVFYNTTAMTLQQITAFIDEQNAGCDGPWCLRNLTLDTTPQPADAYCQAYTGGPAQSAAKMLYDFSRACGINPQVMLVTLQKESQGLTRTDADRILLRGGVGVALPGHRPRRLRELRPAVRRVLPPGLRHGPPMGEVPGRDPERPVQLPTRPDLRHRRGTSPNPAAAPARCRIRNLATASLYVYTPYQPNAASLAAYPGEGDACSSYGNRNFFRMFQNYFGSTGGGTADGAPTAVGGGGSAGDGRRGPGRSPPGRPSPSRRPRTRCGTARTTPAP